MKHFKHNFIITFALSAIPIFVNAVNSSKIELQELKMPISKLTNNIPKTTEYFKKINSGLENFIKVNERQTILPTLIYNEITLRKANNQLNKKGYLPNYCSLVYDTFMVHDLLSSFPPIVLLITDAKLKLAIPFKTDMDFNKSTLNYYSNKYIGHTVCTQKVHFLHDGDNYTYITPYFFQKNEIYYITYTDKDILSLD